MACTGCAVGQTGEPGLVTHDTAEITGELVTTTGGQVEYWFQWGPTKAYGNETPHATRAVEVNERGVVGAQLTGLARSTVYHYRLCARDSAQQGGPGCGDDRTVKTQSFACGETVTSDVRLTGGLWCKSPQDVDGMVIGAPGIVIDFNGFNVTGPASFEPGTGFGIDNSAGFDDVTIHGGSINGFGDGIHLENASGNRILRMRVGGAPDAIDISGGSANEVRHTRVGGRENGLIARKTSGLVMADGSGSAGVGHVVALDGVVDSRILRNALFDQLGSPAVGIQVAGDRNLIRDNRVVNFGDGLVLLSGGDNKLLANVLSGLQGDGLFVAALTTGTIVRDNSASQNGDDGIDVQGVATRIGYNSATDNDDFGIDAVAGVTDLGGNTASGNGNPLECRNVFCQ